MAAKITQPIGDSRETCFEVVDITDGIHVARSGVCVQEKQHCNIDGDVREQD